MRCFSSDGFAFKQFKVTQITSLQKHIDQVHDADVMNAAVVNTLLGGSAGGLTALCIAYWKNSRLWSFQAMLNGAITGEINFY